MKFAFLTYLAQRYPLEKSFEFAKMLGFDGIEVWGGRPHAYAYDVDAQYADEIRAWSKSYGIEISMYTPELLAYPYNLTSKSRKERYETVEYLKHSVETAAKIGTDKMQFTCGHPGVFERETDWAHLVEGVMEIAKTAEKEGILLVTETLTPMESPIMVYADDISRLLRDVGSRYVKGMIDVCAPAVAHEPFCNYFDVLGNDLVYVHLADGDSATDVHLQLGEGNLPLTGFFKLLHQKNYRGYVSLELLMPYFKDPYSYLTESMQKIKSYILAAKN